MAEILVAMSKAAGKPFVNGEAQKALRGGRVNWSFTTDHDAVKYVQVHFEKPSDVFFTGYNAPPHWGAKEVLDGKAELYGNVPPHGGKGGSSHPVMFKYTIRGLTEKPDATWSEAKFKEKTVPGMMVDPIIVTDGP